MAGRMLERLRSPSSQAVAQADIKFVAAPTTGTKPQPVMIALFLRWLLTKESFGVGLGSGEFSGDFRGSFFKGVGLFVWTFIAPTNSLCILADSVVASGHEENLNMGCLRAELSREAQS